MDRRHNANALAFGGVNDVNVVNDALTHLCSMFEDVRRCSKMFEDVRIFSPSSPPPSSK